jgi:hypothetical protein
MSVLKSFYATPSRIKAVYHFMLEEGPRVKRRRLTELLSPATLPDVDDDAMLKEVIDETLRMDLLAEDGDDLIFHPDLPGDAVNRSTGLSRLPLTLIDLMTRENGENDDLLHLIAWYLAQDVANAPGDKETFPVALNQQVGGDKLELTNDDRFRQFAFWFIYLGFGWRHVQNGKEWMVPDPTVHVRWRLPYLFRHETKLSPAEAMLRLSKVAPVFEEGRYRKAIETTIGLRSERTLSSTTAHAWLRLHEEGLIEVERRGADAEVYLLPDGDSTVRCSALILNSIDGESA